MTFKERFIRFLDQLNSEMLLLFDPSFLYLKDTGIDTDYYTYIENNMTEEEAEAVWNYLKVFVNGLIVSDHIDFPVYAQTVIDTIEEKAK